MAIDWWFEFFSSPDYLNIYSETTNPERTRLELQFAEKALGWDRDHWILDAPCGQGRHTWDLHRHGYRVIGLDMSQFLLKTAHNERGDKEEDVFLIRAHLGRIHIASQTVQWAMSLFSSFGYGETDEDNLRILREYARVLAPGGKLLIDVMNRHHIVRFLSPVYRHKKGRLKVREERTIINRGRRLSNSITVTDPNGIQRRYQYVPWLFNGWELSWLAQRAGLQTVKIYGNFDGRSYNEDAERAMLVARKPE
ncbi:MAG: class I SAM-dependent methyltransferase [bacterium]